MRASTQNDDSLLKEASEGRFEAFEELASRHSQRLLSFLWRMTGSMESAERLFEETWAEMWKLRSSNAALQSPTVALFALAARKAARALAERSSPLPASLPSASSAEEASTLEWRVSRLEQALLWLPLKERTALLLCFFDSFSYAQVATCLSEREEHARELAAEGLRLLRALLGPEFLEKGRGLSEHLAEIQLLDLDRVKSIGPLFDQARTHIAECGECRRNRLTLEALRALALEGAPSPSESLITRAMKLARRASVEETLASRTGEEAAREILSTAVKRPMALPLKPAIYGLFVAAAAVALWRISTRPSAPPVAPAGSSSELPFEFGEGPSSQPTALPRLSEGEALEERALDSEAKRLLISHLKDENSARSASPGPYPQRRPRAEQTQALAEARQALRPSQVQPRPTLPAPRQPSMSSDPRAPAPTSVPDSGEPPPSLKVDNTRFKSGAGAAGFHLYFPDSSNLEIRVFDSNGKSVKLLAEGKPGPGALNYAFDGRDDGGGRLEPGTYYARVMTRWFSRVEALELLP